VKGYRVLTSGTCKMSVCWGVAILEGICERNHKGNDVCPFLGVLPSLLRSLAKRECLYLRPFLLKNAYHNVIKITA
jgi:hypothetical protein